VCVERVQVDAAFALRRLQRGRPQFYGRPQGSPLQAGALDDTHGRPHGRLQGSPAYGLRFSPWNQFRRKSSRGDRRCSHSL
jgi:hypothetical protein